MVSAPNGPQGGRQLLHANDSVGGGVGVRDSVMAGRVFCIGEGEEDEEAAQYGIPGEAVGDEEVDRNCEFIIACCVVSSSSLMTSSG